MEELLTEVLKGMDDLDSERDSHDRERDLAGWWSPGQIAEKTPNMEVLRVDATLDMLVERGRVERSGDAERGDQVYRALYRPAWCPECEKDGLMANGDYLCPRCRAENEARVCNFSDLSAYLDDRRRVQKWPTGRIADELGISTWDVDQLRRVAG